MAALGLLAVVPSCTSEAPPTGAAVSNRDSAAMMVTYGVSKMISDSGVMKYKIIAEEWRVFDRTKPPRQEFPKGIFLQRYDEHFNPDLFITADTAYCYNQSLWELRGRVYVRNKTTGTTFRTELLFWDTQKHTIYSNRYMHIVTPDRELEGDSFTSNEQMTRYDIKQSRGYVPMPGEGTQPADTAAPTRQAPSAADTVRGPIGEVSAHRGEQPHFK